MANNLNRLADNDIGIDKFNEDTDSNRECSLNSNDD